MACLGRLALDLPDRVAPLTRVLGWASVRECPLTIRQDPQVAELSGKVSELLSEGIAGAGGLPAC